MRECKEAGSLFSRSHPWCAARCRDNPLIVVVHETGGAVSLGAVLRVARVGRDVGAAASLAAQTGGARRVILRPNPLKRGQLRRRQIWSRFTP